jgi:hypothetical protein
VSRLGFATALAAALAAGAACAAERLIAQTPELVAVTEGAERCGDPVAVTIRAASPGFFEDRERLQRTVDEVRAILTFECARIPSLDLRGEVAGSQETVFAGLAGDGTGWLVEPTSTTGAIATPAGRFPVAQVDVGMTPAEAVEALSAEFGARPDFDAAKGRIEASEGPAGPIDDPFPPLGARRLVGVFSEGDAPRLAAATLRQTVDGDQRAAIVEALTSRYGAPADRVEEAGATLLTWGRTLAADTARRELEVRVETRDGLTALSLFREDPDAPAGPRLRARF